jgi:hypothetical protein
MRLFTLPRDGSRRSNSVVSAGVWSLLSISLWPSLAMAQKSAADYFVHSLPGAPDGPLLKMHAGYEVTPPLVNSADCLVSL